MTQKLYKGSDMAAKKMQHGHKIFYDKQHPIFMLLNLTLKTFLTQMMHLGQSQSYVGFLAVLRMKNGC
jgi:hypothetical protein